MSRPPQLPVIAGSTRAKYLRARSPRNLELMSTLSRVSIGQPTERCVKALQAPSSL
jgi:hypothetical protein